MNAASNNELLRLTKLRKHFPGVLALDDVDISIAKNEIHVLLGENGAGKSTLIKSIIGVVKPDAGEMLWDGELVHPVSIKEAYDLGIAVIYQELSNIGPLSVVENMFVGNEIEKHGIINWKKQKSEAVKYLKEAGTDIDPDTLCENMGMGQKQMVEIAKALQRKARLIIMDEPTASLSRGEIDNLLELMSKLKDQGISILFITHKLDEAKKVGDVVTVLKDGKKVGETTPMADVTEDEIIHMMVGRTLDEKYPISNATIGETLIEVKNLTGADYEDVSFSVRSGEIMGVFGLVGAGRTETMRGLFGADPKFDGEVWLEGEQIYINSPSDAIRQGIVLVSENRKEEGLILIHDVVENSTLPTLNQYTKYANVLNQKERRSKTLEISQSVKLKPLYLDRKVMDFSGGNQQKIVIQKWLLADAHVYIFDEPTKGVDVGAKTEIYGIMNSLAESGAAVIMVSSEMQEIIGMSDSVLTMYEGKVTGYLDENQKITHEKLMVLGTGGKLSE